MLIKCRMHVLCVRLSRGSTRENLRGQFTTFICGCSWWFGFFGASKTPMLMINLLSRPPTNERLNNWMIFLFADLLIVWETHFAMRFYVGYIHAYLSLFAQNGDEWSAAESESHALVSLKMLFQVPCKRNFLHHRPPLFLSFLVSPCRRFVIKQNIRWKGG